MAEKQKTIDRREFLKDAALLGGSVVSGGLLTGFAPVTELTPAVPELIPNGPPASQGYLVVDSRKCAGCGTCMLACSLVHEGEQNLSLSRIQIVQDAFGRFPDDLQQYQCRQCTDPLCVLNCPTGACHVDAANGNVRVIDQAKCIGCQTCINSCPHQPHRITWNPVTKKASKCDLCITTPYWDNKGGPDGKQACVEVCPLQAIKLVKQVPSQKDDDGYNVNLRNDNYKLLNLHSEAYT